MRADGSRLNLAKLVILSHPCQRLKLRYKTIGLSKVPTCNYPSKGAIEMAGRSTVPELLINLAGRGRRREGGEGEEEGEEDSSQ